MKKKWQIIIGSLLVVVLIAAAVFGIVSSQHKTTKPQRQTHPKDITVSKFIKQIAPAAQREQKKYHIPASITIAQAGIESNWGRSKLAYKYNNLFGIKANSKHNRVRMYTTENINGKNKQVKQYFQVYNSWAASIKAHTLLIVNGTADNHKRFRSVQKAKNYREAAYALQKNGYATDPDYASKLIYAIQKFNLDKYD
ncbi:glycoside hydrolase family 73 protein [Limosilactobacillus kribbianus]|uniref:glycoside hydrolase family 73 protein n=1 Tax=Limosilactobacillus kribbianus TaxID=2982695 RepID=UPI0022646F53|nr:glycoside hydrolase family 73 protein [Limosilactobacillus kribbianus]